MRPSHKARELLSEQGITANQLQIPWLVALHGDPIADLLKGSRYTMIIENNYSGQFAHYLRSETSFVANGHISEATTISIAGRGWFGAPGLYAVEQVAGWQKVIGAVHAKGAHMFSQRWYTGLASHPATTNGATPVSPSGVGFEEFGIDAQWLAAAFTATRARHRGNSSHCRGLSQSGGASKSRGL